MEFYGQNDSPDLAEINEMTPVVVFGSILLIKSLWRIVRGLRIEPHQARLLFKWPSSPKLARVALWSTT